MRLVEFLRPELIVCRTGAADRAELTKVLADLLRSRASSPDIAPLTDVLERTDAREPFSIGSGVAIFHCRTEKARDMTVALATCEKGLENFPTPDKQPVRIAIACPDEATDAVLRDHAEFLVKMALLDEVRHGVEIAKPPHSATSVVGTTEVFFRLEGLIDIAGEKERLAREKQDATEHIAKIEKQLHNPDFLANAPEHVVQRQKERAEELRQKLEKIIQNLAELE